MNITVTTQDLNGDGEVHLAVPTEYFLYWGQDLPSDPDSRLAIVPGTLEWTNTVYDKPAGAPAGDPDYYVEWTATFTFDFFHDITGEVVASTEVINLSANGSYYTDTHPGDSAPPIDPYVDLGPVFAGADITLLGSDAAEIIGRYSGPSWYESFGSQTIDGGDGNDDLWNLENGPSIINAGDGDDSIFAAAGGYADIDGGAGDDTVGAKPGDHVEGGTGLDTLHINFNLVTGPLDLVLSQAVLMTPTADNGFTYISGFEVFDDVTLSPFGGVLDMRGFTGSDTASSFQAGAGYSLMVDAVSTGYAALYGFEKIYLDFSGSDESGHISTFYIRHGTDLNLTSFSLAYSFVEAVGGDADDFFYVPQGEADLRGNGGNDALYGAEENDSLDGGAGNDTLGGGLGDDALSGGLGIDTAVFSGNRVDYDIDFINGVVTGADGTDTLSGVEYLQFDDVVVEVSEVTDFNKNIAADIVYQNPVSGWVAYRDGLDPGTTNSVSTLADKNLVAVGDFDGDGRDDVLLQNDSGNGWTTYLAGANGASVVNVGLLNTKDIAGIGDFDGDGRDDVLVQNSSGNGWTSYLAGADGSSMVNVGMLNDKDIVGIGDFDGDGRDDVLLQNTMGNGWTTYLSGGQTAETVGLLNTKAIMGIGDFDGDGRDDLLLQNSNGDGWTTYASGGDLSDIVTVGTLNTKNVIGIGDFDGDDHDDLLLQNKSGNGWTTYVSGSDGQSHGLGTLDGGTILAVDDYDGDGLDDILFRDDLNGHVSYASGGDFSQTVSLGDMSAHDLKFLDLGTGMDDDIFIA